MQIWQILSRLHISRFVILLTLSLTIPQNVWCADSSVTVIFSHASGQIKEERIEPSSCTIGLVPTAHHGTEIKYWKETSATNNQEWLDRYSICQYIVDACHKIVCNSGTVFRFEALPNTITCAPGKYGYDNSTDCNQTCTVLHYCPGGSYDPLHLGASLKTCPAGTACPNSGMSSPINCFNGMYQNASGQSRCSTCPAGTYTTSEDKANTSCLSCPSGTYSTSKANACSNCTNKPAAGSYIYYSDYNTPGPATSNNCSWYLKCSGNQKYDETTKTCKNCDAGFHGTLDWSKNIGVCYISTKGHYLCNPDNYQQSPNSQVTYGQAKTCTANVYTMVIKAEYKKDGKTETSTVNTTILTYNDNPSQTIYTVYSGTQILNPTINNLNKGLNDSNTDKYYAPTSTGQAYLEINGTSYSLQSNYSGGSSGGWTMNASDHNALTNLENGATINLVFKIQSNKYNVVMLPYATNSDKSTTAPAQIIQKDFGDTPSTGVSPDNTKVTKCVSSSNYGYITDNAAAKYYECMLGLNAAPTLYGDGKTAMFEPSINGRHICIGYTMTICQKGYQCNSCSRSVCDNGTHQPDTGKSSCSNCAAGTFTPDDNQPHASCSTCTAGTYSGTKASKCETCGAGTYSGANASKCEPCGAGTYSGAGASGCEPCPAGTYQPQSAQPHCISCQDGTTSTIDATTGLFTSDSDEEKRPTSRELCYINPNIKLADKFTDKFNPDGVEILDIKNSKQILWRGGNPSNSN